MPRSRIDRFVALGLLSLMLMGLPACGDSSKPERVFNSVVRPLNETCVAPSRPNDSALISLVPVFEGAFGDRHNKIVHAEYAAQVDGGRWYFARQEGQIYTIKEGENELQLVMNLSDALWLEHGEAGLMSIAIDPSFDQHPYLYATYSVPTPGGEHAFASRVARFSAADDDGTEFEIDSGLVYLDVSQPHGSHSGDHLEFGTDGYLYFSLGDGGNIESTKSNGQNPFNFYGSMLRVDVREKDPERGTNYRIPPTNPFADGAEGAPEIFAYGFRNPWRFSIDPASGEIWAGDVGQDTREEINIVQRGGNYGWALKEGFSCFRSDGPCVADELEVIDPVWDYSHAEGSSVTGGVIYRGKEVPSLSGRYLFADYVNGNIWGLKTEQDGSLVSELLLESGMLVSSFAYGPGDEAYVVRYHTGGAAPALYKIAASPEEISDFPRLLTETGCVQVDNPTQPADGVVAYPITAPLWADGAGKGRYFAIPDDRAIELDEDGDFLFPIGTVLIKQFGFGDRLHETRLFVRHEDGWGGYSYAWNEEQTDAELLSTSKTVVLGDGQTWTYPTRGDCATCHTEAAKFALGPELKQFAGQPVPGESLRLTDGEQEFGGDFVEWLVENEYFHDEFSEDTVREMTGDALVSPTGDEALDTRARSYLHANCSGCHRPGSTGRVGMDLSMSASITAMNVCNKPVEAGAIYENISDFKVIDPGDPENSAIYRRMTLRNLFQMPPLASHIVDPEGSEVIREWIQTMDEDCTTP